MAKNSEISFLWLKNAISLNFLWLKNSKSLHWGRFGVDLVSVWCRFGVGLGFCIGEVSGQSWEVHRLARRERLVWRCPRMLRSRFPTLSKLCRTSHCPSWQTLVQDTCSPSLSSLLLVFCGLHGLVRGVVGVSFSPFLTPLFS